MEIVFAWLVFAGLVGVLAASRGRSGVGFFLLSTVLSPLVGLVIVLVSSDLKLAANKEAQRRLDEDASQRERQREHEKQLEALKALREPPVQAPAPVPAPPAFHSVAAEIERLGALMEKGLLTPEEFQAQKAALLGGAAKARP